MQKQPINPIPGKPESSHPLPISVTAATPCQQPPPGRPLSPPPPPPPRPPPRGSALGQLMPPNIKTPRVGLGGRRGGEGARGRGARVAQYPRRSAAGAGRGPGAGEGRGGERRRGEPPGCLRHTVHPDGRGAPLTFHHPVCRRQLGINCLGLGHLQPPGDSDALLVRPTAHPDRTGGPDTQRRRRAAPRSLEVWVRSWL